MPTSAVLKFTDPDEYRSSIQGTAKFSVLVTEPGHFGAQLTWINLHSLWMQRGQTSLAQLVRSTILETRSPIFFLTDERGPILHTGMKLAPGEMMFYGRGAGHYYRLRSDSHWATMSLPPEELAAAGQALAGCDLVSPEFTARVRPPPHLLARLQRLHEAAGHLAAVAPSVLAHPEVARAIEQELVRGMVACLTQGVGLDPVAMRDIRVPVMRRFERVLEKNEDRPLYLAEICAAIGVADRTLRLRCTEELGMSPQHYLLLRRMHLSRRALAQADGRTTTVTRIANDYGFGELGRFSVRYRQLFGELPSETLRRSPDVLPGSGRQGLASGRLPLL